MIPWQILVARNLSKHYFSGLNTVTMNKLFSISFLLLLSVLVRAQTSREEFFSDDRHAGGIYQQYIFVKTPVTPAPQGYKPFYISHYGRHGSRWLTSPDAYNDPCNILGQAHDAGKLTALGESLYERIKIVSANAYRRYGDLSELGVIEHRGIAERMFYSFPEVFSTSTGRQCNIYSRSTTVPRCILSMAAGNERLKELNPEINITREASARNNYLNNTYGLSDRDSLYAVTYSFFEKNFDTEHFISLIFTDSVYVREHILSSLSFINDLYSIAADLQDIIDLNITMADVFTREELFVLWQASNMRRYFLFTGKEARDSSKLLLRDILDCAEDAIEGNNISADLRFGHDSYISPLLALMDINGILKEESDIEKIYKSWSDFKVSPMGANLQLIFYRNDRTGDVIVKVLHNEKEAEIPVATDIPAFYHWKDFKAYYERKLGNQPAPDNPCL